MENPPVDQPPAPPAFPRLRYMEATREPDSQRILLRDPTHLAEGVLSVGRRDLELFRLMDGLHSLEAIATEFRRRTGIAMPAHQIEELVEQLDAAGFLAGPGFERFYDSRLREYREAPHRPLRDPDGYGAPADRLREYLSNLVQDAARGPNALPSGRGRLRGLVAPHLDYPRGAPSYGAAYAAALHAVEATDERPRRVVILGTNHFGRSRSVVATRQNFSTPWGVLPTDIDFLERLGAELSADLFPYELDHLHEHSVELHALWAAHLFGPETRLVPFLVPDPSGEAGTAAGDPGAADTREFARALGELIRKDPEPTLLVASADLSHVGRYFEAEDPEISSELLESVRTVDEAALKSVCANQPEDFRRHMAETGNPTRICSVGCVFALMEAVGAEAVPQRLDYHQAATPEWENLVTCCAYTFREG